MSFTVKSDQRVPTKYIQSEQNESFADDNVTEDDLFVEEAVGEGDQLGAPTQKPILPRPVIPAYSSGTSKMSAGCNKGGS